MCSAQSSSCVALRHLRGIVLCIRLYASFPSDVWLRAWHRQDLGELGCGHPPVRLAAARPENRSAEDVDIIRSVLWRGRGHVTPPVRVLRYL